MAASSLERFLTDKLAACDPVLAKVEEFFRQQGVAELGTVYRTRYLFADRFVAQRHRRIEFIGGGATFGEIPNYAGEVGFLFLRHLNDRIYQGSWHGHVPVQRHDDELWCVLYSLTLREDEDIPAAIAGQWKPGNRVDRKGQPFDTWVRFEAMERYLRELVAKLDPCGCKPFSLADTSTWLQAL